MNLTRWTSRRTAPAVTLIGMLAATLASPTHARADGRDGNKTLEGTWFVQVTLRNCHTSAPLGVFNSLVTFGQGGTVLEATASTAFAAGQRTAAHGTWSQRGRRSYTQRMVALILFTTPPTPPASPGFEAGWQTVVHAIEMQDGNHFTSAGSNEFFALDGDSYRTGCSTAVAKRF